MLANFIPDTGRLSFVSLSIPGMAILDGVAWARYRTEAGSLHQVDLAGLECTHKVESLADLHGTGSQQVIRLQVSRLGIELIYRINHYDHQPFLLFQMVLRNVAARPVYLQQLCLFQADPARGGKVQVSGAGHAWRFFRAGWHAWDYTGLRTEHERLPITWLDPITRSSYTNPATPRSHSRGIFWSEGWGVLANGSAAVVAGFASMAHHFGQLYACLHAGEESLSLIAQADGIRLDSGDTFTSEWAYLQFVELPVPDPMADYVSTVARQMQVRLPATPPPMWTHWYQFYHNITEELLLENLQALNAVRESVPYKLVELDDGYQSAWGDWSITNRKFPHGLPYLAVQMRAHGFTPGLWLAPLVVQGRSEVARAHPDWLVQAQDGRPLNAGFFYYMNVQALDTSHPQVLDHLRQLIDHIVHQCGFAMLKLDFLNASALPGRRHNPKLTRAECLRLGLETIRQAAGPDTFLLASGCPFGPAIGLVDAMRIGPDTAPEWEPVLHWLKWAKPLFRRNPSMPSLRNALRHTLNLSTLHQRWWWNDPDCLLVRSRHTHLTRAEVQSAVTLIGLSGGLLVSSDDMRRMDPERLRWVSLLVPSLGLRGLPLDLLEHEMPEVYRVQLHLPGATDQYYQLVGLFNWRDHPADCRLQFERLGFPPGADLHVFDFWSNVCQSLEAPEIEFHRLPAHGCKLLRICAGTPSPQLVGDTLHLSQGAEIASWSVRPDHLSIETIDFGRRVEGSLWFRLPGMPLSAACNGQPVDIDAPGEGIYALHLQFMNRALLELLL